MKPRICVSNKFDGEQPSVRRWHGSGPVVVSVPDVTSAPLM
jgi:hypothetical protein